MDWSQAPPKAPPILWLSGNAASGKSTICSYAIRSLQGRGSQCCYFFFKHGSLGRSTPADCLKSLAYQMALRTQSSISTLLSREPQGVLSTCEEERILWRQLFQDCIFETSLSKTYWVIDAVDECRNPRSFIELMSALPSNIRVLISSRVTKEIEHGILNIAHHVTQQQLYPSHTAGDIKIFIESVIDRLPAVSKDDRLAIAERVVSKSSGSFLWVRLVVQELEHSYSKEALEVVLNDIPPGMTDLYDRMLTRMASVSRGTDLARSILMWATCASRALSLDEVQVAVRLDTGETLCNPEKSIRSICDQFVILDNSSKVQLIHETAREYLLRQDLVPDFIIRKRETNARLAIACLNFLAGDWLKRQRLEKRRPSYAQRLKMMDPSKSSKLDSLNLEKAFATYACCHFSDHVCKSSLEDGLLDLLCSFLQENALQWIEYIASNGDLSILSRTAVNIRRFLDRHARHFPPIDMRINTIEAWVTDLIRVGAKFRAQLQALPGSIHSMIPALCPSDSIIAKSRAPSRQALAIAGLQVRDWDDCITRIEFHGAKASAIACGESSFAVGLSDGRICRYRNTSLQEYSTISHGERVRILQYSDEDRYLVTAGPRTLRLWDLSSSSLQWSYNYLRLPLAITFMEGDEFINIAFQTSTISTLRRADGVEVGNLDLVERLNHDSAGPKSCPPPSLIVFSNNSNLLAVSSRGQPVQLFDIDEERFCLECSRDEQLSSASAMQYSVDAMAFNPNRDIAVLIVSFGDGELHVFNLWSGESVCKIPGAYAHSLACAPDGKCLITASTQGAIQIYDFGGISGDQLSLSYQIDANDPGIRALAFAGNSPRFFDIRATQCRVWEPDFLVRKDGEGSSQSDLTHLVPPRPKHKGVLEPSGEPEISAIYCHSGGETVFCGTRDGSIFSYRALDAKRSGAVRRSTANTAIVALAMAHAPSRTLVSADAAGCVSFMQILEEPGGNWRLEDQHEVRTDESVSRLLFDPSGSRVLAIGTETLSLWSLSGEKFSSRPTSVSEAVAPHTLKPDRFIALAHDTARIFSWTDLSELSAVGGVRLSPSFSSPGHSHASPIVASGRNFMVEMRPGPAGRSSACLRCWPTVDFEHDASVATSRPGFANLASCIEQVIDVMGNTLLFLDADLWICSVDLATFGATQQVYRHFFIPSEWRTCMDSVLVAFGSTRKEFVFAVGSEMVVVKHGLEFAERHSSVTWKASSVFKD